MTPQWCRVHGRDAALCRRELAREQFADCDWQDTRSEIFEGVPLAVAERAGVIENMHGRFHVVAVERVGGWCAVTAIREVP